MQKQLNNHDFSFSLITILSFIPFVFLVFSSFGFIQSIIEKVFVTSINHPSTLNQVDAPCQCH